MNLDRLFLFPFERM